ncbi:hypothetical protein F7725_026180 [Dissostichus mawsoni]|uniref:Uncharacterized protein n=1 Tax=Dissostichus mawsoni TaxID=36200 RepID=A0A7J5X6F1_DISMA|nr:hypothetical protein F7725_026180 [Dissostichus mawsoni]
MTVWHQLNRKPDQRVPLQGSGICLIYYNSLCNIHIGKTVGGVELVHHVFASESPPLGHHSQYFLVQWLS